MNDASSMSDEEARENAKRLQEKASRRVAMLAFVRGDPPTPQGVDNNGTASFIQFPTGKFVVTNHHVWDHFRTQRLNDPDYKLAMPGRKFSQPLDLSDAELIAENEPLDLCVLSYPPERIEANGHEFADLRGWPPQRPAVGDALAVVGYPGMLRKPGTMPHPALGEEVPVLIHKDVAFYPHVEEVTDQIIKFKFKENPEVMWFSGDPVEEIRWGGMSGSLVYRLDETDNLFKPCGVLHSGWPRAGLDTTFFLTVTDFGGVTASMLT
jgi:hypothetical protein